MVNPTAAMTTNIPSPKTKALAALVLGAIVGYGFWIADVTDNEASTLLSASAGRGSLLGGLWASIDQSLGQPMGPWSARALSCLSVIGVLGLVVRHVPRIGGLTAAFLLALTPAALLSAEKGTADALVAFAIIAASIRLSSVWSGIERDSRPRGWRVAGQWFAVLALLLAVAVLAIDPSLKMGRDWLVESSLSVTLALGATGPLLLIVTTVWADAVPSTPRHRSDILSSALGMIVAGVVLATFAPEWWLGGSLALSAGIAVLAGSILLAWSEQRLDEASAARVAKARRRYLIVLPLLLAAIAFIRIEMVYNYMERVQALMIVGLIAAALGALASRRRSGALDAVALVAVLLTARLTWVNAITPEWDRFHSAKPRAAAVASQMTQEGPLYTDMPISPSFRYYLKRPVHERDDKGSMTSGGYVLSTSKDERGTMIRRLEGFAPHAAYLWRDAAPESNSTAQLTRDEPVVR